MKILEHILNSVMILSAFEKVIIQVIRAFQPIFVLIIIITIINIILKFRKYGSQIFSAFKNKKVYNYQQQIIVSGLRKIEGNRRIIPLTNYKSDILVIDEGGIYLIIYYNYSGTLRGNVNKENLVLKKGENSFLDVPNPYKAILDDEKKLKEIIKDQSIKKYIVFNNNCSVQIEGVKNVESIFLRHFHHVFKKEFKTIHAKNIDIDKYYNKIIIQIYGKSGIELAKN